MVAKKALRCTEDEAFGGLLGTFGGHFGSILGTFWAHFGGPERAWKKMPYKGGGVTFWRRRFLLIFEKKNGNFGTRKREPNRSQEGTEKGRKKGYRKK